MYRKTFESKVIRITNKHHKKLLERFDKNNFTEELRPPSFLSLAMINNIPCALCRSFLEEDQRSHSCGKCPVAIFEDTYHFGCTYIMSKLITTTSICTSIGNVTYRCVDGKSAIGNLKVITDFLKSFEKEK